MEAVPHAVPHVTIAGIMNWKRIQELKDEHREAARLRPIEQKLALLERLRDRTRVIAEMRPRPDGIGEQSILVRPADPAVSEVWGSLSTWRLGAAPWILTCSSTHLRSFAPESNESNSDPAAWTVTTFGA